MARSWKAKALAGLTAGAIALTSTGAAAQYRYDRYDRYDRHRDGIGVGEIIAGAVVIGGLAAVLNNIGRDRYGHNDRYRYDDRYRYGDRYRYDDRYRDYGYDYDYNRYGNARQAVDQCVRTVENRGTRWGRTDVTQVRDIQRTRTGYNVRGNVVVRDGWRDRWGRDGYYDQGRFTCEVRYGQIRDIRFNGLG